MRYDEDTDDRTDEEIAADEAEFGEDDDVYDALDFAREHSTYWGL